MVLRLDLGSRPLPLRGLRDHTHWAHHTRQDSSERAVSPSQRPLRDNTQHSQQTGIHAPGGIRTHNPSKRTTADPRLRPRGHWDRQCKVVLVSIDIVAVVVEIVVVIVVVAAAVAAETVKCLEY